MNMSDAEYNFKLDERGILRVSRKGWKISRWATKAEAQLLDQLATALAEKDVANKIIKQSCDDWAQSDTTIKAICEKFGIAPDNGNDYFKCSEECVQELADKFIQLQAEKEEMEKAKELVKDITPEGGSASDVVYACADLKAIDKVILESQIDGEFEGADDYANVVTDLFVERAQLQSEKTLWKSEEAAYIKQRDELSETVRQLQSEKKTLEAEIDEKRRAELRDREAINVLDVEAAAMREALTNLLTHAGIADAHIEDIDQADHQYEWAARELLKSTSAGADLLERHRKEVERVKSNFEERYENRVPTQWAYDRVCVVLQEHKDEIKEFENSCNAYKVEASGLRGQLSELTKKAVKDSDELLTRALTAESEITKLRETVQELELNLDNATS